MVCYVRLKHFLPLRSVQSSYETSAARALRRTLAFARLIISSAHNARIEKRWAITREGPLAGSRTCSGVRRGELQAIGRLTRTTAPMDWNSRRETRRRQGPEQARLASLSLYASRDTRNRRYEIFN